MKPIQLTMQAFGSYGKKTVIDFTKPDQNLFLITGDTGSRAVPGRRQFLTLLFLHFTEKPVLL